MSQTRWQKWYTPTTYGGLHGSGPVREVVSFGQTGPPDLVAHEMRHYLKQHAVLGVKFPGEMITFRQSFDPFTELRKLPRIFLYLSSTIHEERPTAVALEMLTVYCALLADQTVIEDVVDGEATVGTVIHSMRTALRTTKARVLTIWDAGATPPRERQLAMDVSFGGTRLYRQPVVIGATTRVMELHEVPVTYRLDLDKNSGQIINLQAA